MSTTVLHSRCSLLRLNTYIIALKAVGIPTTRPTAMAPRNPAYHMAAAFPMDIFLSLERHKFNRGIKENTETARPIKIKIKVKPVKLQDISLITPTVAIMPKANAGCRCRL